MGFGYLTQNLSQRLRRKFRGSAGAGRVFGHSDFPFGHQRLIKKISYYA
jgi:hypothetical protein